jgi:hypothetical protein
MLRFKGFQAKPTLAAILVLMLGQALPAQATVTTFEGLVDAQSLTNEIPGLTFTNAAVATAGVSLNEVEFPPHSGSNVIFDNGGPISVVFAAPQTSVGAYFTYTIPLTVSAYDSSNLLLGSVTSAFTDNLAISSLNPPNEFLSLTFANISKVIFTGFSGGGSFVLDDLTYSAATQAAVPEPAAISLLGAGVLLLTLFARRRPRPQR